MFDSNGDNGPPRGVPSSVDLHYRLLDESIQHCRNAKLSHSAIRLRDFYPFHRLRFIGPVPQLFSDDWPMLLMGFAIIGPLARHRRPRIRFLFIGSRVCSTLPSDPTS
jgi:hypothetical protein